MINKILYNGEIPGVSIAKCRQSPYEGVGWADLRLYYWASKMVPINGWIIGEKGDPSIRLELELLDWHGMYDLLYGKVVPDPLPPISRLSVLCWQEGLKHMECPNMPTVVTPLWHGTWLTHAARLVGFRQWDLIGISNLRDVLQYNNIKLFEELAAEFHVHKS